MLAGWDRIESNASGPDAGRDRRQGVWLPLIQTPSFIMKVSMRASTTGTGLDHANQLLSGRLDVSGPLTIERRMLAKQPIAGLGA